MTYSLIAYSGYSGYSGHSGTIEIVSPTPSAPGGAALNANFEEIGNALNQLINSGGGNGSSGYSGYSGKSGVISLPADNSIPYVNSGSLNASPLTVSASDVIASGDFSAISVNVWDVVNAQWLTISGGDNYFSLDNKDLSDVGDIDCVSVSVTSGIESRGTASSAQFAFANHNLVTLPTDGTLEYDGTHLFLTIGTTRYQIDQQPSTSGYSGYSGKSGYSGYSGKSGYSGYSGISGSNGSNGSSGVSGYSGYSGKSGYSGYSGTNGSSGVSGYSGYSGVSGYSGYSGVSGTGGLGTYVNVYSLTRAIPTTVNNEVDIGAFTLTNGSGNFELWITVPSGGYSQTKRYFLPAAYNSTGSAWQKVLPISTTGIFSGQDLDLNIQSNLAVTSFRLLRTAGTTAGTAYITIVQQGVQTDTFSASTSTGSVSAPTVAYQLNNAEGFISSFIGLGMTSIASPLVQPLLQLNNNITNIGSFSVSNWNSVAKLPAVFAAPTSNGGSSPSAYFPALVLSREGVGGQSYGNFAEFKIGRFINSGTNAKTGLQIALTDGNGDATGTNVLTMQSNGCVGIINAPTAGMDTPASTTTQSGFRIRSGAAPTSPNDGDIWYDGTNIKCYIGGATKTII